MTKHPRFEILVGLHVVDDESYDKYRAGMKPILKDHGGFFRYGFRVSEMLKGEAEDPFNRVFILSFPDKDTEERFFSNEDYLKVRNTYFGRSVQSNKVIAAFDSP